MTAILEQLLKLVTLGLPVLYYVFFVIAAALLYLLTKHTFKRSQAFALVISFFAALMVILVCSIFFNRETLMLTVYVHGPAGKQDITTGTGGKVTIDLGNKREVKAVAADGAAIFLELPVKYKNKPINIVTEQPGYQMAHPGTVHILADTPVYIMMKKDNSLGIIKGIVKEAVKGQPLAGADVYIGNDTVVKTNAVGIFDIVLPEKMRVAGSGAYYRLVVKKEGYLVKEEKYYPNSNPVEIRLPGKR
jgi:hypothetical protein